jgi:pilus assembly protein Flp/PilA
MSSGALPMFRLAMTLRALWDDERGATAVEYGLIVAAIAGLLLVVIFTLGGKIKNTFNNVATHMP